MAQRKLPPPQDTTGRNPTIVVVRRREGSQILHTAPDDGRFGGLHLRPPQSLVLGAAARHARARVLSFRPAVIRRTPRLRLRSSSLPRQRLTRIGPFAAFRFRMRWRRGAGRKFTSRLCGSDATSPIWRVSIGFPISCVAPRQRQLLNCLKMWTLRTRIGALHPPKRDS